MNDFDKKKYCNIISEIRERILSAELLSQEKSIVLVESTTLQMRIVLELIAYLSVLVNHDKLNSKLKKQFNANTVIKALSSRTTIFYPFPSKVIPPQTSNAQPVLIPFGFDNALTQIQFKNEYDFYGGVLHAQHPFKDELNIEQVFLRNKTTINKLKGLLRSHTVGIKRGKDMYTFLHVEIDFNSSKNAKHSTIHEYNSTIYHEEMLIQIFEGKSDARS